MSEIPFEIDETKGQTKLLQLVHSITAAISAGKLKVGDTLPSVNQLSIKSGFSRDTVFKAYNILKKRNIIESAPQKGYFVANESLKVLMLLDDFSAFKEQLYQSFRQNLPENYSVDLLFHHYNSEVFQQLIESSIGRYSVYIIMNIDNKSVEPVLEKIDLNKLLILDMGRPKNEKMNYLVQDFHSSVQKCLGKGIESIQKYDELILVYEARNTPHPAETVSAVRNFCKKHLINFRKVKQLDENDVEKGKAYFVIRESDLVAVIKACRKNNFTLGKDTGVISYNDSPMKQVVGGGISVISTDFELMGFLAADFVKNKQPLQKVLPTLLTLRESL